MEALPPEILQEISWLATNPEFYLVSRTIYSKLPSLNLFERDLILLLFCERTTIQSAWGEVDPFPWQTAQASKYDPQLSPGERTELQRVVLNQSWLTLKKFKHTVADLCRLWVEKHWETADMTTEDRSYLQNFLSTDFLNERIAFPDVHGNELIFSPYGRIRIFKQDSPTWPTGLVVEVLYIPQKVFTGPRSASKLELLHFFRRLTDTSSGHTHPECYPNSVLREALFSALLDEDINWFMGLFGTVVAYGINYPVDQLVHELSSAAIRERKWTMMRHISGGIRLPEDFFEATLAPALAQAIRDGDLAAGDLLRWIEDENWGEIQSREDSMTW